MKCEDHHTKKLIKVLPYNCLYLNKGNNSSVKGSILTKLIGYQESIVLIICTKNELNLTSRYWDMVPDRQKVRTDGRTEWRTDDAKTISLRLRQGIKMRVLGQKLLSRILGPSGIVILAKSIAILMRCEILKPSGIVILAKSIAIFMRSRILRPSEIIILAKSIAIGE